MHLQILSEDAFFVVRLRDAIRGIKKYKMNGKNGAAGED
jgi:hypothetical protein